MAGNTSPFFVSLIYTRLLSPWEFPGKCTGVGCLQETPNQYQFLLMERNRKKIFTFTHTHTKPKSENSVQHLSCQKLLKQQHALPAVRGTTEPLPCTSPESILSISTFICVCEHLSFILIYFVHSLARCVLRYLPLYFRPFQFKKDFIGTLHFWIAREICIFRYD